MTLDLDGRVFVVLGSSRGIGRGIAAALLAEGASVVVTGRDRDRLEATAVDLRRDHPDRVASCAGDLAAASTLAAVSETIASRWPSIDGVVANAGAVRPADGWNLGEEDWRWYFDANLWVNVRAVTHFIPRLIEARGSILFVGSIAGLEDVGAPLPYASAKSALTMYAKGLARTLGPAGVRVNTIAPGNVIFPEGNWDRRRRADPDGVQRMLDERVPLRMFGEPADIGGLAAFLLSRRARFITGGCFVVDGGQTARVG